MKTNIISNIFAGHKNIIRIAAIAAVAAAAVFGVQQSAPKADADHLQYVKLCRYYNPALSDFYSTTSRPSTTTWSGCAPLAGYSVDVATNEMILAPNQPQPFGSMAVYTWFDGTQDYALMRANQWPCATPGVTRRGNFTCVRKEGYIWSTPQSNAGYCGPTVAMGTQFSAANNDFGSFPSGKQPSNYALLWSLGNAAVWFC